MSETLNVTGLTQLELRELEGALGQAAIKETGQVPPDASFPEPIALIIASVAVSSAALTTLAIILSRPRSAGSRRITISNGTFTYEETGYEIGAPLASTVKAIGSAVRVDLDKLNGASPPSKDS